MSQDSSFGAIGITKGSFCNACDGFVAVCHYLVRWPCCTETPGWSDDVLPSWSAWPQQDQTYWRSRDRGKKSQDDGGTMLVSSKKIIHTLIFKGASSTGTRNKTTRKEQGMICQTILNGHQPVQVTPFIVNFQNAAPNCRKRANDTIGES